MALFSTDLLDEMRSLPGASHAFLRQLSAPEAAPVRERLERAVEALRPPVAERVQDQLCSLDNRRFFQGFAELGTIVSLQRSGWTLLDPEEGTLRMLRPGAGPVSVLALGFVHSARPSLDRPALERLHQTLSRVRAGLRFGVYVRRHLPPGFDPEPVRQAVELWVREVEAGRWEGRFASYEDDAVVIEFGLSGEPDSPSRAVEGTSPVIHTIGPFNGSRIMGALEQRVLLALDRAIAGPLGREPMVVTAVADQPWRLSRAHLREFLYGRPRWSAMSPEEGVAWEACLGDDPEPCLFKDPQYRSVVLGVGLLDRPEDRPLALSGRWCANPFGSAGLQPGEVPFRLLTRTHRDGLHPVVSWVQGDPAEIEVG